MAQLHVVPQFYLNLFTDPDTPAGQTPYLWIFDKSVPAPQWKKRAPKNVAAESDYYVLTDKAGAKKMDIEEALHLLENAAAPVITKRILKRKLPTLEHRFTLAAFLVSTLSRVPTTVESVQEAMSEVARKSMVMRYERFKEDPDYFTREIERFQKATGVTPPFELTVEDFNLAERQIEARQPVAAAMALVSTIRELTALVARMGWTFFCSSGGHYFMTSDFPVGLLAPATPNARPGFGLRDIEVSLPFSREIALVTDWANPGSIRYVDADPKVVEEINVRTAIRATALYAPRTNVPAAAELVANGSWASAAPPEPGVKTHKAKDGYYIEFSLPKPWLPSGKRLRLRGWK